MTGISRIILFFVLLVQLCPLEAAELALNKTDYSTSLLSAVCFWKKEKKVSEQEMEKKQAAALIGVEPLQRRNLIYATLINVTDLPYELIKMIASYDQLIFVHDSPVLSLSVISPTMFAAGGSDGGIKIWSREQNERPKCCMLKAENPTPITALRTLSTKYLVSCSSLRGRPIRTLNILSAAERQRMLKVERDSDASDVLMYETSVQTDGYMPDDSYDETLNVWDHNSGQLVGVLVPDTALEIRDPAASTNSNSLMGYTRIWNLSQKSHRDDAPFRWYAETLRALPSKVSRSHHLKDIYLYGCQDGKIIAQGLGNKRLTYFELKGHTGAVRRFVTISDTLVASASDDGTIKLWFIPRRECVKTIYAHTKPIRALELLDKTHVVSGSEDGTARIHDVSFEVTQCREEDPCSKEDQCKGFIELHVGR